MEMRSRERRGTQTILAGATPSTPAEALIVQGEGLVKLLERECAELHALRQKATGTPAEAEMVRM